MGEAHWVSPRRAKTHEIIIQKCEARNVIFAAHKNGIMLNKNEWLSKKNMNHREMKRKFHYTSNGIAGQFKNELQRVKTTLVPEKYVW
jgi:hypothetical protein